MTRLRDLEVNPQPSFDVLMDSIIGETIATVFKTNNGTTIVFDSGDAIQLQPRGASWRKIKREDVLNTIRQRREAAERAQREVSTLARLESLIASAPIGSEP